MDEILYELRDHASGLNAGRWDYLFIDHQEVPARPGLDSCCPTATRSRWTRRSCAPTPSCSCRPATSAARSRSAGWRRSSRAGATRRRTRSRWTRVGRTRTARPTTASTARGSRIPDLVPIAMEAFDEVLGIRPNQLDRRREDVSRRRRIDRSAARPRGRHRGRSAANVSVVAAVPVGLARGNGAVGDQQPDGGRRDRGDRPLAGVAVDQERRRARRPEQMITRELVAGLIAAETETLRCGSGSRGAPPPARIRRMRCSAISARRGLPGLPDAVRVPHAGLAQLLAAGNRIRLRASQKYQGEDEVRRDRLADPRARSRHSGPRPSSPNLGGPAGVRL